MKGLLRASAAHAQRRERQLLPIHDYATIGGVVGSVLGGAVGAVVGASIGGAVGVAVGERSGKGGAR